jgi:diaminohydroxyphosphoribosylaminopyrimidine deaminase/5-amino-6-(5-phosphoribosylamino)uracil reductase
MALALRGSGRVSPNPRVGCVIVKQGRIIGEGWHHAYGDAHAEVEALRCAVDNVAGSTMYITLEPCSHIGKTPACAPLIIEQGIARVVIAMEDPNPLVAGSGIQMLRDAGVQVDIGICADECRWLNRFFVKHITTGMPYVVGKVAQTLDGCIATSRGQSMWITCEESRRRVHIMRAELDAVLVGRITAQLDDPRLDVRAVQGRNPWRVVLDSKLSLGFNTKLYSDRLRHLTIVCCSEQAARTKKARNLKIAGVHVLPCPVLENGRLDTRTMLQRLSSEFNIASILVEGGSKVLSAFASAHLLDELHFFVAPILVGNGQHSFAALITSVLKDAQRMSIRAVAKSGDDVQIITVAEQQAV